MFIFTFAAATAFLYLLGAVAAFRIFDRTMELTGSSRDVARARAGLFWPARILQRVGSIVAKSGQASGREFEALPSDLY
ncbi:MAG: hypothetical protein O3C10_04225 [Chloroflexi bacterium]|nr:hypothetical protein [Chloroflexota bacterium]